MPKQIVLKGGDKELSDFFKVFSFDEMRDKSKKKKEQKIVLLIKQ